MAFKYWYRNNDGDVVEILNRVQLGGTEQQGTDGFVMNAEEGSVGTSHVVIDDPTGDFDINGLRLFYVTETECAGDAYGGIVYDGYTWTREYSREREFVGAARTIDSQLSDINSILERRILVGSDCDRPAETDVERITWLLSTSEAELIEDDTYFSTDGPVAMDACDYRGQSFRNVFDDCSQQSGKNWFLWRATAGRSIWYMPRGTTDFASDIKISNDPDEIDVDETGAGTVFPPAATTRLTRDPSRVYSGVWMNYAKGHVYVQKNDTAEAFARRDVVSQVPNVKTKAKAKYRANRYLADISTEEDVITTAIVVLRAQANDIVEGQRVQVKFTHLAPEGYGDWVWMRVLNRTVREQNPAFVELALELSPDEPLIDQVNSPGDGTVFGILARAKAYGPPYQDVWFDWVGDFPDTGGATQPTVGLIEALHDDDGPFAPTWVYYGFKMLGSGTIDVKFYASTIGIGPPDSVTFCITKNGVVVASQEYENVGYGNDGTVTVTALPVSTDDVIGARIVADPPAVPFFQSPRGTGDNAEALTITGGSLS